MSDIPSSAMTITPEQQNNPPPSATSSPLTSASTTSPKTDPTPALATTKRKFHRLLENLTKPSSSKRSFDTANSTSLLDTPAKRIRLEARTRLEAEAAAATSTNRPAPGSAAAIRAEARAKAEARLLRVRLEAARPASARNRGSEEGLRPATAVTEPNYNPWSHEGFLKRLSTYRDVRLWSSKPDAVNEVAWAKRGWVCVDVNTVSCKGGCEQRVVVGLRPPLKDEEGKEVDGSEDMSVEVSDELVKRVGEVVVQGHAEECLWRHEGCRDGIYRLPLVRHADWEPQLKERYAAFAMQGLVNKNLVAAVDVEKLSTLLPPDFNQDISTPPFLNTTALAFALHGWTLSSDSSTDYPLATCTACFRRLGLWLYSKQATDEEQAAPPSLNLTSEHRPYCPYINAHSQHMSPGSLFGLNGIEVLDRSIQGAARFRASGTLKKIASSPLAPTDRGHVSMSSNSASQQEKSVDAEGGKEMAPALGDGGALASNGVSQRDHSVSHTAAVETQEDTVSIRSGMSDKELRAHSKALKAVERERQAAEDRERFARLRALTKTLGLKGLGLRLRGRMFN